MRLGFLLVEDEHMAADKFYAIRGKVINLHGKSLWFGNLFLDRSLTREVECSQNLNSVPFLVPSVHFHYKR